MPWQGVKIADKKQKYEMIRQKKSEMTLEELCQEIPSEFVTYMKQVRQCAFEERPDYDSLRFIFKDLFYRSGFEYDYNFDWMKKQRRDRLRSQNNTSANGAGSRNNNPRLQSASGMHNNNNNNNNNL